MWFTFSIVTDRTQKKKKNDLKNSLYDSIFRIFDIILLSIYFKRYKKDMYIKSQIDFCYIFFEKLYTIKI